MPRKQPSAPFIDAGLPLFRRDTTLVHPLHLEARGADDRPVQTVGLAPVSVYPDAQLHGTGCAI